jgi:adenine phosphoribosyltransferase
VTLDRLIRDVPDFPKAGIVFKDVTPLLQDAAGFREAVDRVAAPFHGKVDTVVGIESRGFIFGAPVAYALGAGLSVVRKPGKLPAMTIEARYDLEYGSDALQIHADGIRRGSRVLLVDDLLATGGTAAAAADLVRRLGGEIIACTFLIELVFLGGRTRLEPTEVFSILRYE